MGWLGLDGALGSFSAALVSDDSRETSRCAQSAGNDALERGLDVVDRVLAGTALEDLAGIAVTIGPGSFTGLRIALAYAKSLAFAAHLPLVALASYDVLEAEDAAPPYATFVSGRPGFACVRIRHGEAASASCGSYAEIADAIARSMPRGELLTYGPAEGVAPALGERGIIVRPQPPPAQPPALAAAFRALHGARAVDPHAVVADYGEAHYAERSVQRQA